MERLRPYLWALIVTAVAILLRAALSPIVGVRLPFITLFPAVFVSAYLGGLGPTLLTTLVGIGFAVFWFSAPTYAATFSDPVAQLGMGLFGLTGAAIGWLGETRLRALQNATQALRFVEREMARAEQEAVRAEEEAARAEEESARAEEETLRAEEQTARAEQEAKRAAQASERVERILSSITDAFTVMDHQWTITYMNERAAAMAGGKPSDYIGRNHWEAFPAMVGSPFEQAYRQAVAGQHAVRAVAYYQPRDKWIEVTAYPSSEGLTVVGQDVTERVRREELTAQLAAIVASSEDAIIGKTLQGIITSWNAAAERIFGYAASEIIGTSIYRLIPTELHGSEHEILQRVGRGEPVAFSQAERIRK